MSDKQSGWIYCLSNPSMPGVVKIGLTTNTVEERVKQLDTTGVPSAFKIEHRWQSDDVRRDEKQLHDRLRRHRLRGNREFFRLSPDQVSAAASMCGFASTRRHNVDRTDTSQHRSSSQMPTWASSFILVLSLICCCLVTTTSANIWAPVLIFTISISAFLDGHFRRGGWVVSLLTLGLLVTAIGLFGAPLEIGGPMIGAWATVLFLAIMVYRAIDPETTALPSTKTLRETAGEASRLPRISRVRPDTTKTPRREDHP